MAVVEELLSRGAKIDAATKKGNTALHIASLAGQVKLCFFRLCFMWFATGQGKNVNEIAVDLQLIKLFMS